MGSDNFRQVGTFDFTEGIGTSVSGTASSFSCSNQSVSDKGFSKESVVTRRGEHSYSEGCVGGDGSVLSSYSGSTHSLLPRRFSHQESLPISFGGTHQFVYPFTPETGFFDFMGKSEIIPSQSFNFLGEHFRTDLGLVLPPEEKVVKVRQLVNALTQFSSVPARQLLQLVGFLISIMDVIPLGRLHIRPIQWYLSEFWHPISQLWEAPVPILPRLLPHLQWWLQEKHLRKGVLLDPPDPSLTLFTDASLMGWGAYLEGRTASGLWSGAQLEEHINLLEMRAVFLSLRQFQAVIQGQSLLVATDNSTRGSTVSIQRKKTASGSGESPSARLVVVRNSLRKGGFSEGATKRISGSVRQSTGAVYDSKWSIFCTWCLSKQINPLSVTVQQLADFFLYLFEEKGYSPSTIKGYRSAIARTISLSGGSDFGDNEFLSLLIKNFCLNRPRQRRLVPSWDLGLVLKVLQFPPFEPLHSASFKFLSYKCCFLIALATGRRRSEIHALSISESCLRFASDKSSVTLLTDPSFLAKNQLPDKGSGFITVPALPPTADNQVLCPVRALLVYLASSAKLRSAGSSRLFIPIKKGISDISAKTISTWICNTVILAYKSASSEVLVKHQVKAHEVVMNIVVAFILEQFLFRMQYNRKMEVKDIEDHAKHTSYDIPVSHVIITGDYIVNQSKSCDIPVSHVIITGDYIVNQSKSCDIPVSHVIITGDYIVNQSKSCDIPVSHVIITGDYIVNQSKSCDIPVSHVIITGDYIVNQSKSCDIPVSHVIITGDYIVNQSKSCDIPVSHWIKITGDFIVNQSKSCDKPVSHVIKITGDYIVNQSKSCDIPISHVIITGDCIVNQSKSCDIPISHVIITGDYIVNQSKSCDIPISHVIIIGDYIVNQAKSCDIPISHTPYLYKGERFRNKDDYSLKMYSDEVKTWIEEDEQNREEMIANLENLRQRRRVNYSLNLEEEPTAAPVLFHRTVSELESPDIENSFA
ncbi:unnamed protein product [Mytilus edulis]|uniref:Uncharacterized protein n=1 Tax=Mytilus edulis TaxID=6550 RepID=A0A8S3PPC3_MYTED|nr:unnamed protein product [Mytilus edulis]